MNANSENDEADELDDDEVEEVLDGDDVDLDRVYKDMESAKRRATKGGEPAWRILEQRMERKHTAELISDFEDYDIDNIDVPLLAARR
jgi:hypothetical protein